MARSIFRQLNRLYGTTPSLTSRLNAAIPGIDRATAAPGRAGRLEAVPRVNLERVKAAFEALHGTLKGKTVAVVGGGMAGLSAAFAALQTDCSKVTLYEATPFTSGRVQSVEEPEVAPGRIIERGAEFIGTIHPVWLYYARQFGLGMVSVDDETYLDAVGGAPKIVLDEKAVEPDELAALHADFTAIQNKVWEYARGVDPIAPWTTPTDPDDNLKYDTQDLASWLRKKMAGYAWAYGERSLLIFLAEMENDNVTPANRQSVLGFLASISAGGEIDGSPLFFSDVELFRCDKGNQALSQALYDALHRDPRGEVILPCPIGRIVVHRDGSEPVELYGLSNYKFHNTLWAVPNRYDLVVFAAPTALNGRNGIEILEQTGRGRVPVPVPAIQTGNAVKVHMRVDSRFWLGENGRGDPNGNVFYSSGSTDHAIGQMWDATSNQAMLRREDHVPVVVSTFAGSRGAEAAIQHARDVRGFYKGVFDTLQPGWPDGAEILYSQINDFMKGLNAEAALFPGYSCPAPGEVTGKMQLLNTVLDGQFAYAGEHCSPGFFGYMEGALVSGINGILRFANVPPLLVASKTEKKSLAAK